MTARRPVVDGEAIASRGTLVLLTSAVLAATSSAVASRLGLEISKNLNVWSWRQSLGLSKAAGDRLLVTTNALYVRNLSNTPGFMRRSSETNGDVQIAYAFTPRLTMGLALRLDESSVQSGATTSKIETNKIATTLDYRPFAGLTLSHSLGRAYDKRRNVADAGLAYGLGLTARPFEGPLRRHGLGLAVSFARNGVSSRQGDVTSSLSASLTYAWSDRIKQDFQYADRREEQKYVSGTPGNRILRRLTENRNVTSAFAVALPWLGDLGLVSGYVAGRVEDDASDDPSDLKYRTNNRTHGWNATTTWALPFHRPALRYVVSLGKTERQAEPIVLSRTADSVNSLPNDLDRRISLLNMTVSASMPLGQHDSAFVSGSLALSRHHTPAQTEVNDREDYRRALVGAYRHRFTHATTLELRLERTETHQVWLTRYRSANNKWDRAFNFWAATHIQTNRIAITQRSFFRTALEEFDFDYLTPEKPRSRNTRVARLDFTGILMLTETAELTVSYSVEARLYGNLLSAGEGKRPKVWQLTENELSHVLGLSLTTSFGNSWQLGPGISLNRKREYIPTSTRWNPFDLGRLTDEQEGMQVDATASYTPRHGVFGGNDAVTARMTRVYRRRAGHRDTTSYASLVYQHGF